MRPTFLTTALLVCVSTMAAAPARADHVCSAVLSRNARLLERVTCDLKDHIHEEYEGHPWSASLCQSAETLHIAACQLNSSIANRTTLDFVVDDLSQACDAQQQLARLLRATGVPACVQADLNRAGSLITRMEQYLDPTTPRVPALVPPVVRTPGQPFPGVGRPGRMVPHQPGPVSPDLHFPGNAAPYDPRGGNGIHVPAPSARHNTPAPSLYLAPGANGRPEVGLQMGNVRLTFSR